MIEVSITDPTAQHGSLKAERPDAAFQFQRRLRRHRHRQRGQRLEAVGPSNDGFCDGIVGAARQIDAFRPEIVQGRRGQRQDLNVKAGLVHQGQPLVSKFEQAPLDLA